MPRTLKLVFLVSALLSLCAPVPLTRQGTPAPDPQFEQAVALYRKGDTKGAAKEFPAPRPYNHPRKR